MPGENVLLFADSDASVYKCATFATKHLWVTPSHQKERYPAGDCPNQHAGEAGLPAWTQANRSLENTNVVLWYKDAIGLPEVLFQSITAMAPAAAISSALTPAIPLAGASLPLAVFLATIACALIAAYIGMLLTIGLLLLYITSCISTIVFYRRERPQDFRVGQHVIVPIIPTIILLFPLVAQVYPTPPYPLTLALPILLAWIVIGVGILIYLNRNNPAALERSKVVFLQDTEVEPTELLQVLKGRQ